MTLRALAALALLAVPASAQDGRVSVCHRIQGGDAVRRLEVDASAVPAHLAHGDSLAVGGACDGPTVVGCGGFGGFPCPDGATCIDVPDDGCDPECGGADCPGFCVTFPPTPCDRGECPPGFTCVDVPDDCDPDCGDRRCPTACAELLPDACGGIAGFTCPPGAQCVDALGDGCGPECGADFGGRCVVFGPLPCGGPRGDDCPAGSTCVDDFRDDCGADCETGCARICVTPLASP